VAILGRAKDERRGPEACTDADDVSEIVEGPRANLARIEEKQVRTALEAGLSLVNVATEPVSMRDVAREAFGVSFANDPGGVPPRYDVRTKHAAVFGGRDGYLRSRSLVLGELRAFVAGQRKPVGVAA
jgi:hypothetical protein